MIDVSSHGPTREPPQVCLGLAQASRLREFLDEATPPEPLRLEDTDEAERCLMADWSRSGSRLTVTVTSASADATIGEVALHPDQVGRLRAFLADVPLPVRPGR